MANEPMPAEKCACGVTLTAEEIEYYGHSCNECEGKTMFDEGDKEYARLDAVTKLRKENENLRTVMIAAAEEIHAHWKAHCDADGYGPANLMIRLEAGLASEYAYKAGDFERMRNRIASLESQLAAAQLDAGLWKSRYDRLACAWDEADKAFAAAITGEARE